MAIKPISPDEFRRMCKGFWMLSKMAGFDVLSKTSRVVAREAKVKLQETSPRSETASTPPSWATTRQKAVERTNV